MKTITADQAALRILLSNQKPAAKQAALTALATQVDAQTNGGECPNCGSKGPHDDNGDTGHNKSYSPIPEWLKVGMTIWTSGGFPHKVLQFNNFIVHVEGKNGGNWGVPMFYMDGTIWRPTPPEKPERPETF